MKAQEPPAHPIIFYDGVCGLCNRLNQFVLARDLAGVFRFASLQSGLAHRTLARHGADPTDLNTLYVVLEHDRPGERLLQKSDAAIFVLRNLPGIWPLTGTTARLFPRGLRDFVYGVIARHRYRVFGKLEACLLPDAEHKARFLDP